MHFLMLPSGRYLNLDLVVDVRPLLHGPTVVVTLALDREDVGTSDLVATHYEILLADDDAVALLRRLTVLADIETGYLDGMRWEPDRSAPAPDTAPRASWSGS